MISSETPDKLAEILRDTWPQLYRPSKSGYNKMNRFIKNVRNLKIYQKGDSA